MVYFGYATSARIRDIRAGLTDSTLTAQQSAEAAQLRTQAAQQAAELVQLQATLGTRDERLRQITAHWEQTLAQRDERLAQQERELAQLRELAVQPLHSGDLDLMQLAQALREPRAIPWREIEQLIGVAQSTLRARLKSTSVAHILEVAA